VRIEVSEDGLEFIIRIPRNEFSELGGLPDIPQDLTARQREVFLMIAECKANKEIAAALNITVRCVKFHVTNLLARYKVTSRHELVALLKNEVKDEMPGSVSRGTRDRFIVIRSKTKSRRRLAG
jgi:DNA-binding CsgD family transcriptional regulator